MISKVEGVRSYDPQTVEEPSLPIWFDQIATHKSFHFGPTGNQLYIPLCKIVRGNEFQNGGIWSSRDIVKRKWKDVTCHECLKHRLGAKNDTRVSIQSRV